MKSHGGKRELTVEDELTEEEKRNLFGHLHVPSASDMSMHYRSLSFLPNLFQCKVSNKHDM